jgi:hypothetical protein
MADVLLVPGALIFEADWGQVTPDFAPDRLARRLTRARRTWQALGAPWSDGAAHLEWLARAFGVPGDPPASAAYAWREAGGPQASDSSGRDIWFCEPVHLSLEPERTVLAPIDTPPLTEAESRQLFDEAADSAREHGAVLRQAAGRWYLFPDEPWDLRTTPLQAALGASVEARLPQGKHASHWRRLLNEVQMRWHVNRVNRDRETQRQQTANGLWLHGGGAWHALDASRFARVESDDAAVLGWLRAGHSDPDRRTGLDSLTVRPQLFEPYWRRDWQAWAAAWKPLDSLIEALLSSGGSGHGRELELVASGRRGVATFALGRRAGLLPWRHRALRECLLEPTAG